MANVEDVTTMLSSREVAQELGVTPGRVRQMVVWGEITGVMRGGSWFFTREQVELARQRPKVGSKRPKRS